MVVPTNTIMITSMLSKVHNIGTSGTTQALSSYAKAFMTLLWVVCPVRLSVISYYVSLLLKPNPKPKLNPNANLNPNPNANANPNPNPNPDPDSTVGNLPSTQLPIISYTLC